MRSRRYVTCRVVFWLLLVGLLIYRSQTCISDSDFISLFSNRILKYGRNDFVCPAGPRVSRASSGSHLSSNETSRFVSLADRHVRFSPGVGNHLFILTAMLYVAEHTGRQVALPSGLVWKLDDVFDIDDIVVRISSIDDICPCVDLVIVWYDFDDQLTRRLLTDPTLMTARTLRVHGFGWTFQYAAAIEPELRRVLRFHEPICNDSLGFFRRQPVLQSRSSLRLRGDAVFRVGVHVRRGDFLEDGNAGFGMTVADAGYFERSFAYFTSRYDRVAFIVATNDLAWTKSNLPKPISSRVTVSYSENNTAGVDLAILTQCDALIISTGTFGWWAAWLANKIPVIYYKDYPQPGSLLDTMLNKTNYYPKWWISLS